MDILSSMRESCPLLVTRVEAQRITGGLVKARTLANLDCLGKGPSVKVKLGRIVAYSKDSFLEWLSERLQEAENV
ncbi:hypothetical protein G3N56_03750 [Desulfovibrio sulfodismutans]|uniref:DNA-binding protein n=1 Tax=Desulfolutivibrio sulfodismutans TaxID=63561 RepID=A0A7K3NJA4_9BACT|nr:hypothetical protein [Desulfolutivibrio sulfodismutans]NDY55855.1 hypothetical protein [Desulfolutivibrio sulfodismutans]QLA14257.1 hypothetical protein GD606_19290 [Desulfolutivibrio sulfodismutans DSM 3696]